MQNLLQEGLGFIVLVTVEGCTSDRWKLIFELVGLVGCISFLSKKS